MRVRGERERIIGNALGVFLFKTVLSLSFSFFHHHIKKNTQLYLKMNIAK